MIIQIYKQLTKIRRDIFIVHHLHHNTDHAFEVKSFDNDFATSSWRD